MAIALLAPSAGLAQTLAAAAPEPAPTRSDLERMAEDAAKAHLIPVDYFKRLIRQESGFDRHAVSPVGAQGIAQFMPGTAAERGLRNPFDPSEALPKSAALLRDLWGEFGNAGLAAAAYNAGPARVRDWLAGRRGLPLETVHYVRAITGRGAEHWAPPGAKLLPPSAPGHSVAGVAAQNWESALLNELRREAGNQAPAAQARAVPQRGRPSRATLEGKLCPSCVIRRFY